MFLPKVFDDDGLQDAFEIMIHAAVIKLKCKQHDWDPHKVLDVDFEKAMSNELENKV